MLHTACDLFSAVGKQWLALVDRFSGYVWMTVLCKLDTKAVIQHLEQWFIDFGWPTHIRTDGGPQFRSEFIEFCAAHGITPVSYTHLRAHETGRNLVCRLLLEKKK